MTSTSYLAVSDRPRPVTDRDHHDNPSIRIIGAARPSAVRALLARSITMTALELERRLRTRRRHPSTKGLTLPQLALRREREVARARYEQHVAETAGPGAFIGLR